MTTPPRPAEPIEPQWTEVLRTYGEGFAGRKAELAALHRAWNEGVRVFVLYAEGGAGKTRVVAKWLTELRDAGWRGAGAQPANQDVVRGDWWYNIYPSANIPSSTLPTISFLDFQISI